MLLMKRTLLLGLLVIVLVGPCHSEVNMALGKKATQRSDHKAFPIRTADKAVDGCLVQRMHNGCCSHTDRRSKIDYVWWQVDLVATSTITNIVIYYRDFHEHRLAGYKLYLSNTTDWTEGQLCYEDKSTTKMDVNNIQNVQCPYVAQYVTIYNERQTPKRFPWYSNYSILELCEVQVFGCQYGFYGTHDCTLPCPSSCPMGTCNPWNGSCFGCDGGFYGERCNFPCSENCLGGICDDYSGSCKGCDGDFYGEKCNFPCPENCLDGICDDYSGICKDHYQELAPDVDQRQLLTKDMPI